jgi:hypothetical protein
MRPLFRKLALLAGAGVAVALALEGLLRLVPVQDGPNAALEHADPDVRFEPGRRFTWSRGWRMRGSNELATNNLGFVSPADYEPEDPRPLTAVIGDSYVQALMIPEGQSLTARLRTQLGPQRRVYSFAASGSPLSKYLAFADLARRRFAPEALVLVVVGNDFDESLRSVEWAAGFHHFTQGRDGQLALERRPLPDGALYAYLRRSALVNYLFRNLEARAAARRLRAAWQGEPAYVGNTPANASPERVSESLRVIDAFLTKLPLWAGLPPARIVLVIDALRGAIYQPERASALSGSFFARMHRALEQRTLQRGYAVIDMQSVFSTHYAAHAERFEFPDDGHWNALAHRLAAEAIAERIASLGATDR